MKKKTFTMVEKMFLWGTESGSWHFLPVTKTIGIEINKKFGKNKRGFGSLPVEVSIGKTTWNTSIFPERSSGSFILPVKAAVRKKEGLQDGEKIKFAIKVGG